MLTCLFLCFVLGTTRFRADLSCFFRIRMRNSNSLLEGRKGGREGGREEGREEEGRYREDDLECT